MEQIKHRVTNYWSQRAEGFEVQRLREYDSEKRERWLTEFRKYLPQGRPLRILDVGTGTGFFACLLAAEGHETTGIDLTPDMIEHAKHMAAVLGLDARFLLMDAEEPEFEPTTKETSTQALLEVDGQIYTSFGSQKCTLLNDHLLTGTDLQYLDLSGEAGSKGDHTGTTTGGIVVLVSMQGRAASKGGAFGLYGC